MNILFSWIGNTDLTSFGDDTTLGPIVRALMVGTYDRLVLLDNYHDERVLRFVEWLKQRCGIIPVVHSVELSSPTAHKEIYTNIRNFVQNEQKNNPDANFTFHTSPGTPAMALCWFLLAPMFGANLIESSKEQGVNNVNFPFELAAYFLPDKEINRLASSTPPIHAAFKDIVHKCAAMQSVVRRAQRVAGREVIVLIEGESGTGKELFARAIHDASNRAQKPFIPVNCGAIPSELVESHLYGYKKDAFTGATKDTNGFFQAAEGGTLFLDELGELPHKAQVSLLRAIQERAVVRVGDTHTKKVNVRIIAATNRYLLQDVAEGKFRSDLFYRLAVACLTLPPLRERSEDIPILIDAALAQTNKDLFGHNKEEYKKFSDSAKKIMRSHFWPGNVRELYNTVTRIVLWTYGDVIGPEDVQQALFAMPKTADNILERPWEKDFSLDNIIGEVAKHYIDRALRDSNYVKSNASKLLGFNSYQTLSNWMRKYQIK